MTLSYKLIAAGLLLAVLSGLALLYGNAREETGRLEERTTQLSAQAEWRKNFDRDRAASALRVSRAEANLHAERRKSDALKADIARRDKDAADWLAVRMPIPLSDLVWLRDTGPISGLSGGDGIIAGFDVSGRAYRTSHEQ